MGTVRSAGRALFAAASKRAFARASAYGALEESYLGIDAVSGVSSDALLGFLVAAAIEFSPHAQRSKPGWPFSGQDFGEAPSDAR